MVGAQLEGLDGGSDVVHCHLQQVLTWVSNLDLLNTTLDVCRGNERERFQLFKDDIIAL